MVDYFGSDRPLNDKLPYRRRELLNPRKATILLMLEFGFDPNFVCQYMHIRYASKINSYTQWLTTKIETDPVYEKWYNDAKQHLQNAINKKVNQTKQLKKESPVEFTTYSDYYVALENEYIPNISKYTNT